MHVFHGILAYFLVLLALLKESELYLPMKNRQSAFRRIFCPLLCIVFFALSLAGCKGLPNVASGVTAAGEFPVKIGDVTVSARPQKAVVLSPSLADVVLALGYETQLAAGTEACTQESLGALQKIPENDPQAVLDVGPDLVLAESFDNAMATALSGANVTMLAISPATGRGDFERLYSQVASAFAGGGSGYDAGISRAQEIFSVLDDINRIVPKETVVTACYLYNLEGNAVTGDMFGNTILSCAGVTNAFYSHTGGCYDFEALRIANPNVIFCVPGLKAELEKDSEFSKLQAVKNGRVLEMDPSYMAWQGRTVIEAAYEISAFTFPQLLEESSASVPVPSGEETSPEPSASLSSVDEADLVSYPQLSEGDSGDDVLKLQQRLEELGYLDIEYDGHFGEYTAGCLQEFQLAHGLPETGVADQQTQAALFSKKALKKGDTPTSSSEADSSPEPENP